MGYKSEPTRRVYPIRGACEKLPWFHSIAPADFSAGAVFVTGPQWAGPTTVAISLRDRGRARLFLLEQFEPCLAHKLLLIALAMSIRPDLPIDSRLEIARLGMSGSECFDRVDVVIICQFAGKRRRGDGLGAVAIFGVRAGGPEPCAATVGVRTLFIDLDRLVEIGQGFVVLPQGSPGVATFAVGSTRENRAAGPLCSRRSPWRTLSSAPSKTAAFVGSDRQRIEPVGFAVIVDGFTEFLLIARAAAPDECRGRFGVELDRLVEVGDALS